MSEPTKEEMLCAISAAFSCYRTWRWGDEFGTMEQRKENAEIEIAIRRLIEKGKPRVMVTTDWIDNILIPACSMVEGVGNRTAIEDLTRILREAGVEVEE